jgi:hypothetical protein
VVIFPLADVINPPKLSGSPGFITLRIYFLHKTYVGTCGGALILQLITYHFQTPLIATQKIHHLTPAPGVPPALPQLPWDGLGVLIGHQGTFD